MTISTDPPRDQALARTDTYPYEAAASSPFSADATPVPITSMTP